MIVSQASALAPALSHRNALLVAHIAAVLFGLTGILGALIHADATVITAGRAVFAVLALGGWRWCSVRPCSLALFGASSP